MPLAGGGTTKTYDLPAALAGAPSLGDGFLLLPLAAGVAVELCEIAAGGASRTLKRTVTNADGRTDQPLVAGMPIPIAVYELRFAVSDYFARRGAPMSDPPFLGIVPIRFAVAEPEGKYHVPLSVTPWAYATYRGS